MNSSGNAAASYYEFTTTGAGLSIDPTGTTVDADQWGFANVATFSTPIVQSSTLGSLNTVTIGDDGGTGTVVFGGAVNMAVLTVDGDTLNVAAEGHSTWRVRHRQARPHLRSTRAL